ncbi:NAD/NADP octopine/nopaline dehydrogenase family protein [Ovoidimarina sediminis]|uniref:NAD/NADP octopine/nopaline dehydrogenase family protein n=1 Tax=Ovoidimarina sediminis TaxID=3079856 RepID=UPI002912609C|nr:NAD/NADP octopine/nopaline dehydrogenase family protein [Rhodophyticola sp. MJ-SS7]MDU8942939.1 NAD/NADP octopine/nopaline dehydrogenase family protein [Rhodophyticola sp. MJ-SS7]
MEDRLQIGIAGAGSIAFGTAALLSGNGHDPMLWSPSGTGTAALAEGAALTAEGAIEAELTPRIAGSARQLAEENEHILIALPAYGHKAVMDALAPHIRDGQHVIISSHASLGAIYLGEQLAARGITAPVTAWGTTAVTGRKQSATHVRVNTVRKLIDLCTVPDVYSDEGLKLCQRLFGDRFQPRDGLLAISLSNLNPQNHMGIALGNMTRMERGEDWSQGQNVTPNVGRLLEALDAERLAIADALGLKVRTIFEHFHLSFHVPVASISEMNQQMHAEGNGGTGPATADSRYVTEDVPYGLALTAALGRMVGRPAVLHAAGIRIFSAMYGRDFMAENALLDAIDLSGHSLEGLKEAAKTGLLTNRGGETALADQ